MARIIFGNCAKILTGNQMAYIVTEMEPRYPKRILNPRQKQIRRKYQWLSPPPNNYKSKESEPGFWESEFPLAQ